MVDYGVGNTEAFVNMFKKIGIPCRVSSIKSEIISSSGLILPGVGTFDFVMRTLENSGLIQPLENAVLEKKVPILGVCVGMQVMCKNSEEGTLNGLGWFDSTVKKIDVQKFELPIPHMGWNTVCGETEHAILNGFCDPEFYFLHSFAIYDADDNYALGKTNYGGSFDSILAKDNIIGSQFHPEKSHDNGKLFLENFCRMSNCFDLV